MTRPGGRRWLADGLLWLLAVWPLLVAGLSPPYDRSALLSLAGGLALSTGAVAVGRRFPVVALVLVVGGSLLDGNYLFVIPFFAYLAGRRAASAVPAGVAFAVIAAAGTVLNLVLLGTGAATWFLLASVLLFAGVLPWLVGRYRRQQVALARARRRHEEARDRERRGLAERVRLRERARIAREMHDSLGHDLSLIALRAAALELAGDLPAGHRSAAGELRASVAAATERLHGIIGLLREDNGPASVRPAGGSVADLVDGAREAGMTVRREPAGQWPELPVRTAAAVHRVVREALTNAARYAPGAPVTVTLDTDGDRVALDVVNGPPPAGPLPGPPSTGSGLLGLTERVRLAGGVLTAGPRADGGFTVAARLPRHPPVPDDASPEPPPGPSGDGVGEAERRVRDARRRVRRSLLVALGAPAGIAAVLTLVYYPVVTAGTVLSEATYARLPVSAARAELDGLPRRPLGPTGTDRAGCEQYTDGNFPLAVPTWRLCFADGRLVSKERIEQ
ncbi:two-component sensor histidine kinase [Micromonospora endolithica]|uniref:histidine kinase n=1 Tax=Micromonospora endolithica TaxID=230091 RepID=A0A3A9ZMT6_9ACTN|nr:two-component sensor histidine kinase [Micromonospora endolithica]